LYDYPEEDRRAALKFKVDFGAEEFFEKQNEFETYFVRMLATCTVKEFVDYCRLWPEYLKDAYMAGNFDIFKCIFSQCEEKVNSGLLDNLLKTNVPLPNQNVRLRQFVEEEISKVQNLKRARKRARTCGDAPA
jgi:hypothetical protein